MFLKLTNSHPSFKNEAIILNSDHIVSIRSGSVERADKTIDIVTLIHMPPHGTWEVKETPEDIAKKLKKLP